VESPHWSRAPHWKVRPFVLTRGRARTREPLLLHTLVSVPQYDPSFAAGLAPEARLLYRQACTTSSVAELSAHCGLSLGVTRVVLDDLVTATRVLVHREIYNSPRDLRFLERVRDGLLNLA
jgi:hypothetical protein